MSVQYGRWAWDASTFGAGDLKTVARMLAPYGPDREEIYCRDGVAILFRSFDTTRESKGETQPHRLTCGSVFTWDGRLDNRQEIARQLGYFPSANASDGAIASKAFEAWRTDSFAKLLGDWAISIWNPKERSLLFAKDVIGLRPLYYSASTEVVSWCTLLDPLVLLERHPFQLNPDYIGGWVSSFPAPELSPFVGIASVPPASFVKIREGRQETIQYWDFDPGKRIIYSRNEEYEEHFRALFAQAVERRLRADRRILAELSGGIDSTSIVCMADQRLAHGACELVDLETVSYFDDADPRWNERPYFSLVEERRGRRGTWIDVGLGPTSNRGFDLTSFAATPAALRPRSAAAAQFERCLQSLDARVVLSGIGGDEVTGGIPSPVPELADLLVRGRFLALGQRAMGWAVHQKTPCLHLLRSLWEEFLPPERRSAQASRQPAVWLRGGLARIYAQSCRYADPPINIFGPLPSFQVWQRTIQSLRAQVACFTLGWPVPYEKRYPYLDRDLLELMIAIPSSQLAGPGDRRSLMRRALAGIVPADILGRRRKAAVSRVPMDGFCGSRETLASLTTNMLSSAHEFINETAFRAALADAERGRAIPILQIMRTLGLEIWLRDLAERKLLAAERSLR